MLNWIKKKKCSRYFPYDKISNDLLKGIYARKLTDLTIRIILLG